MRCADACRLYGFPVPGIVSHASLVVIVLILAPAPEGEISSPRLQLVLKEFGT